MFFELMSLFFQVVGLSNDIGWIIHFHSQVPRRVHGDGLEQSRGQLHEIMLIVMWQPHRIILSVKILISGEFSNIFHNNPMLNFTRKWKIKNGDDTTHWLAFCFHIFVFLTCIHTKKRSKKICKCWFKRGKKKEKFPSVNARVMTPSSNASENVNVKQCNVFLHIYDTWWKGHNRD